MVGIVLMVVSLIILVGIYLLYLSGLLFPTKDYERIPIVDPSMRSPSRDNVEL